MGEVGDSRGSPFNRNVEWIQTFQKLIAIQGVLRQHINDFLNFAGDDVAAGEITILEDGGKNPLRKEMLNQHLLHRSDGEIRIH